MARDLPLPVHVLLRRAHNAKSPKDRHDTAYFAWEVSLRLAVAARPPRQVQPLARASIGTWVEALAGRERSTGDGAVLAAFGLFTEVGAGRRAGPEGVSLGGLFGALSAYRNRVIGHGSVRASAFYDEAAVTLVGGLEALWYQDLLLPRDARLTFVEAVELDPAGTRRARLLELHGDAGRVADPRGTADVPGDLLPGRLYLRHGDRYRSLHPWVLFHHEEFRERVFFFNGLGRRAEALDYASGDILRGAELDRLVAGAEQDLLALFGHPRGVPAAPEREDEADRFGGYRILGKLGEGGMGVVYLAEQESLHRLVALKMLPANLAEDATALARFRREVAALSRCDHPNVVKILASGEVGGTPYYAMEYIEGTDLARVAKAMGGSSDFDTAVSTASEQLRQANQTLFRHMPSIRRSGLTGPIRSGRDRYRQLAKALRDAARGIHHLHEAGIVHRDIKPGNLMVTAADHRVVVMDLGLAMVSDATRSITRDLHQVLGTLRYMPPEQLQRHLLHVDRRADVYSLGASFYELLTECPFLDGSTEARLIEQVLHEHPVAADKANPRVPPDLSTIIGKATAKDAKQRYDSAEAMAEDVDAWIQGRPIAARPPTLLYLLRLAIRRNKAMAATVAACLLLVLGGTAAFMLWLDQARREAERERNAKAEALQEAEIERDAKGRALAEVLRLADSKRAGDLLRERDELWPIHPDRMPAMEAWLIRARAVLANGDGHRARLAALRATSVGATAADGPWRFERSEDDWKHQVLSDLVTDLEQVATAVGAIEARRDASKRALRDSLEAHAEAWDAAIAAIADTERYPQYGGLRIPPQLGLVPLGVDPGSGLFEFAHVGSGSLPLRNPQTGTLRARDDQAIVLVLIPGGTFRMGAQRADPNGANHDRLAEDGEGPVHTVTLSPFFLSKYELTQAQWEVLTGGSRPSGFLAGTSHQGRAITARNPVEQVSWDDCSLWLPRQRLTLPTEAQWEFACRAGTTTPWNTGAEPASLDGSANVADTYLKEHGGPPSWLYAEGIDDGNATHAPVGSFQANSFGLHDMAGNVWEWCVDAYDLYSAGDAVDPVNEEGKARVARGGSWGMNVEQARSSFRNPCAPGIRDYDLGVRPAAVLQRR